MKKKVRFISAVAEGEILTLILNSQIADAFEAHNEIIKINTCLS